MPENVKVLLGDAVKKQREAIEQQKTLSENINTETEADNERSAPRR